MLYLLMVESYSLKLIIFGRFAGVISRNKHSKVVGDS